MPSSGFWYRINVTSSLSTIAGLVTALYGLTIGDTEIARSGAALAAAGGTGIVVASNGLEAALYREGPEKAIEELNGYLERGEDPSNSRHLVTLKEVVMESK